MERVELVLKQERARAAMYRETGISSQIELAQFIEGFVQRVDASLAASGITNWLPEDRAIRHSGMSQRWVRSHYPVWEAAGHAFKAKGIRYYRQVVLPWRSAKDDKAVQVAMDTLKVRR